MLKRLASFLLAITILFGSFIGIVSFAEEANESESKYEIYPIPQKETYLGTNFNLTNEVNLVIEEGVDRSTKDFLNNIAKSKFNNLTISEELTEDKTNLIVGIKDSNGYVDEYFNDIKYDNTIFTEDDAYVLNIENGTIAILGKHTDAVYYGLATLDMIFNQIEGKEIQAVKYEDYADTEFRGFIEGYYGHPWPHEGRISLMEFGSRFKMNSYIFGPKDDVYHNKEWRKPYPQDELEKLQDLVEVGNKTKVNFVWAIHPGQNMIKWIDYDKELEKVLNKYEQLYSIGVRQFGLFMDDIDETRALNEKDWHMKLIGDVVDWIDEKGDVKPLIFCPTMYSKNRGTRGNNKEYLEALRHVPENVEIIWTGNEAVAPLNSEDFQWPKNLHGRDSFVWLNWPVNDFNEERLLLGKGEVMEPGIHHISGLVTNPMSHAELSKISLFAIADYAWNVDEFNDQKSWEDSFKYIAPEVASEFNTIAYHLSNTDKKSIKLGESENIRNELEMFLDRYSNGESIEEVGNILMNEFDNITNAINSFNENNTNQAMAKEIEPWLNSLGYVVEACKYSTNSAMALEGGDLNIAWRDFVKATKAIDESQKFKFQRLNGSYVTVEAGAKRLIPFANDLIKKLSKEILTSIGGDEKKPSVYTNVTELKNVSINSSGATSEISNIKNIYLEPSQYIGIKLPNIEKIYDIKLEMVDTELVLETSINGVEWEEVNSGGPYKNASHIRLINKGTESLELNLEKMIITTNRFTRPVVSHNYKGLREGKLENVYEGTIEDRVWFNEAQHVGKYVQIDIGGIAEIHNIAVAVKEDENDYFREGDLQISLDGKTWETVHSFKSPDKIEKNFPEHNGEYRYLRVPVGGKEARYIRLISTKYHKQWLALNKIIVNEGMQKPGTDNPMVESTPIGKIGNEASMIIDNNLSTCYIPQGDENGELIYKLADSRGLAQVMILQDSIKISNAKVFVKDIDGFHEAGTLSEPLNRIDISNYKDPLEIKIEWGQGAAPEIYEIIPIAKTETEEPEDSDYPLSIENVEKIEEADKLTIKLDVKNFSNENVKGLAILKLKDDNGRDYKVEYKDIQVDEKNNIIVFELDSTNYPKGIKGAKAYIWDSLDNMKPLADVKEKMF